VGKLRAEPSSIAREQTKPRDRGMSADVEVREVFVEMAWAKLSEETREKIVALAQEGR